MFVIISGTTCSGKTTVAQILKGRGFNKIITVTTRPKRQGEDHTSYKFLSEDEFAKVKLLESNQHGEFMYGVEINELANAIDSNKDTVLILDPNGMRKAKRYLEANNQVVLCVFLNAAAKTRVARLCMRETNTDTLIDRVVTMMNTENSWAINNVDWEEYDMLLESDKGTPIEIAEVIIRHVEARNSLSKSKGAKTA